MLSEFEIYITRRLAPTSVRLRMFWLRKFEASHDLASASAEDFYDYLASNPAWMPATKQTIVASLRLFYRWAALYGHIPKNPTIDLKPVKVPRRVSRIASDRAIMAGIGRASLADEAMLRLGSECGLRVSEIASLSLGCRDGDWLTVTGKGGQVRSVYLSPELAIVLDQIEASSMRWGFYFPGSARKSIAPSTVWRHIRTLTGLNTHSLRHRAGTAVYRNTGYDLRLAQEFLGHASPNTTAIYVHVEREELIRAAAATRLPRAA